MSLNYRRCEACGGCWDSETIPPHICYNAGRDDMERKHQAFVDYLNERDEAVRLLTRPLTPPAPKREG